MEEEGGRELQEASLVAPGGGRGELQEAGVVAPGRLQEASFVAPGGVEEDCLVALSQGGHCNMVGGHGRVVTEC